MAHHLFWECLRENGDAETDLTIQRITDGSSFWLIDYLIQKMARRSYCKCLRENGDVDDWWLINDSTMMILEKQH